MTASPNPIATTGAASKIARDERLAPSKAVANGRRAHNLALALRYVEAGCPVFAAAGSGDAERLKRPHAVAWSVDDDALSDEGRAVHNARYRDKFGCTPDFIGHTRDAAKVRSMWSENPDAVPAIPCGPAGFTVIDADFKIAGPGGAAKDGPRKLKALLITNGTSLDEHVWNDTQSGGMHVIFRGVSGQGNTAGRLKVDHNCDVRGDGGFIVAPGSIMRVAGQTRQYGSPELLFAALASGGLPVLPSFIADLIGAKASKADSTSPKEHKDARGILARQLEAVFGDDPAFWPDTTRFDLVQLASWNGRFASLIDAPSDDASGNRYVFLQHIFRAYPNMTDCEAFALCIANEEVTGTFTGKRMKQNAGELSYYEAAHDIPKARATPPKETEPGMPMSASYHCNVVDLDDYREDLMPAELQIRRAEREAAKLIEAEAIMPTDTDDAKARKLIDKESRLAAKYYLNGDMLSRVPPKFDWAVKGVAARGTTTVLAGRAGAGKTGAALDLAGHIALGLEWNGRKVQRGVVVYVALENPHLVEMRWRAWLAAMASKIASAGLMPEDACFVMYHAKLGLVTPTMMKLQTQDETDLIAISQIAAKHYGLPIAMVILDTLSKSIRPGNPTEHGALYVQSMQRIAEQTARPGYAEVGANVLCIAHPPKNATSNVGGSYALEADVDTVLIAEAVRKLRRGSKEEGLEERESNSFVLKADDEKFRVGDPSKIVFPYRKESVQTGVDEDGEPETVMLVRFRVGLGSVDISADDQDHGGEIPHFTMSDTTADRRRAVLECLDIEARKQKADDESLTDARRAASLTASAFLAMLNKGRIAAQMTPLGRSTVSTFLASMVAADMLTVSNDKKRPLYSLSG